MSLTRDICEKALSHKYSDFPEDVVNNAKLALLDNLGCAIRGLKEPLSKLLAEELVGGEASASAFFSSSNHAIHPSLLAQLYGAAAHAIDFDDTLPTGQPTHTGSSVVGAILAILPQIEVSGKDILTAIVAAYEANSDIGLMLSGEHYFNGFHPTSAVGIFAATIASGRLLGLNLKQMQNAMGIASSQAAGLKSTFGTMTKPFNAGQAGSKGVLSASLAKRGFTGPIDALEAPKGYLDMFLGHPETDRPDIETGSYRILDNMFKFYAACHATHPMIEALQTLQSEHGFKADDIETIETTAPPLALKTASIKTPKTGLESKFSFPQMGALAVCGFDPASDECFGDSTLDNEDVNAMRERIVVHSKPMDGFAAETTVNLKSGQAYSMRVDLFKMMDDKSKVKHRMLKKFMSNTAGEITSEQSKSLSHAIMNLEMAADARTALRL